MTRSVLAAALAAAVMAAPAGAAPRDQIVDPKNDARGSVAGMDIHTVRWSLTGSGAARALTVKMTLGSAPRDHSGVAYEAHANARGCGAVWFEYSPGTVAEATNALGQPAVNDGMRAASLFLDCGGVIHHKLAYEAKGNAITWSIPLTALPPQVQPGALFSAFEGFADFAEPVVGSPIGAVAKQSVDYARGDGVWKMK